MVRHGERRPTGPRLGDLRLYVRQMVVRRVEAMGGRGLEPLQQLLDPTLVGPQGLEPALGIYAWQQLIHEDPGIADMEIAPELQLVDSGAQGIGHRISVGRAGEQHRGQDHSKKPLRHCILLLPGMERLVNCVLGHCPEFDALRKSLENSGRITLTTP